jgi:hypothetical protein
MMMLIARKLTIAALSAGVLVQAGAAIAGGAAGPDEERAAPGSYTGLDADFLARGTYAYRSLASDRYIRYGAVQQGRRPVYDRLGQFLSYGSYGLKWDEVRDGYTQQKLDAGIDLNHLRSRSGALRQFGFFSDLGVVRESYGQEAMSIAVGRNMSSAFTPLIFNQMQYGGLRIDYRSRRHDMTFIYSRGGTLEQTLFSNLIGDQRDERELSPVLVAGANWIGHFGNLDLGATFFRQLQSNVKSKPESLWRGDIPYPELRSPKIITVRVTDDSPRDLGGVAVFDASILVSAVVDGEIQQYTSSSTLNRPGVIFDPTMVRIMGQPSGRRVGRHWEADGPDELVDIVFELDPSLEAVEAEIEVMVEGDYRIAVRQVHDFQVPGTTRTEDRTWPTDPSSESNPGTFFEDNLVQGDKSYEAFYTVRRSSDSPAVGKGPKAVRFMHAIPTAQTFYGANIDLHTDRLRVQGEYVYNPQDFKFPTRDGRRVQKAARSGYLTALARMGSKGTIGAEVYRIDPTYGGWYDSRRGGLVLFTDVGGDVKAGEQLGTEAVTQEFRFFDDNDDNDGAPDDMISSGDLLYTPLGAFERPTFLSGKPEGGVYPGFDMDGDHVLDFDRNRNGVEDYLEPFLGYDSDPPEFDHGIDFNNNLVPDYRENDDEPDYPYHRDQQGVHLFYDLTRRPWWLNLARIGWFSSEEIVGGHSSKVKYFRMGLSTDSPQFWTKIQNIVKRVQDDIPDDVYRILLFTVDPQNLSASSKLAKRHNAPTRPPPADFLPMRNSVVNTSYIQGGWLPLAGVRITNTFKYVLNRHLDDEDRAGDSLQEAETLHNFSMVNKVSYQREITPDLTITSRVKHLLAKWDEGSYSPVDTVVVGSEASWSLVTPEILATYKLTPRTRVEFGQHGLFIPLLRSRFTDRLDDANNYTQNISVLQVGMSGDFGGYKMVANVGVRWENRYLDKSSELEDTDLSAFFIDVIFGVE